MDDQQSQGDRYQAAAVEYTDWVGAQLVLSLSSRNPRAKDAARLVVKVMSDGASMSPDTKEFLVGNFAFWTHVEDICHRIGFPKEYVEAGKVAINKIMEKHGLADVVEVGTERGAQALALTKLQFPEIEESEKEKEQLNELKAAAAEYGLEIDLL